jgi:hypothetical protein
MSKRRNITLAAAACAVSMAAWAGHLNAVLEAELDGREEVNTSGTSAIVGDPDGRGEAYVFGIDGDATTLCYVLIAKKIGGTELAPGGMRMAHIHRGARGTNGPVVANLAWPQDGQAADCLTEGEAGKFPGNPPGIVAYILANPNEFYVNVHNDEFPGGAVRGQLSAVAH